MLSVVVSDSHTSVDPDSQSQRLDVGSWDQSMLLSVVIVATSFSAPSLLLF